ncbi:head-tail joining protein [Thalassospira marina]|uniref:Uncharacterized protein n=1 Tax=Thalassospira marina TaxID=2048283 RepID=A0A2N3KJN6_9PROT|nr:hypothetical protein [Thalassospira marina]PKR50772.1 hypothetical protein COO20_20255 [Thalassospira marina]
MIDFDRFLNQPVASAFGQAATVRHQNGQVSEIDKFDYRQNAHSGDLGGDADVQFFDYTGEFRAGAVPVRQGDFIDVAGLTFTVDTVDPDDTGWVSVGLMKGEVRNV